MMNIGGGDIVEFEKRVKDKVIQCVQLANQFYDMKMDVPVVRLNQRGRAAGTAYLQRHEVRFNHYMFKQDPNAFLESVVPHEISHLIVFRLYGGRVKPHGKEWQSVMKLVFGVEPTRTHGFDVKPAKSSYTYVCACTEHNLTIRRHNKILKGCVYQCRQCRTSLKEKSN